MAPESAELAQRTRMIDRRMAGVIVRFAVYFAVFDALILWLQHQGRTVALAEWTAAAAAALIRFTGVPASVGQMQIFLPNRVLVIILECTAVFYVAAYSALVLAYPVPWSSRGAGLLAGLPAIVGLNLVRLAVAARVSVAADPVFGFAHDYLFQVGMVLAVALIFVTWLGWCRRREG